MSGNKLDWKAYIDDRGEFQLPRYLYTVLKETMKYTLDMGTLLSDDPNKLRAYKEQIKKFFGDRWINLAQILYEMELITPCGCSENEFCEICGGARYLFNGELTPDIIHETVVATAGTGDPAIAGKLDKGLRRAIKEMEGLDIERGRASRTQE